MTFAEAAGQIGGRAHGRKAQSDAASLNRGKQALHGQLERGAITLHRHLQGFAKDVGAVLVEGVLKQDREFVAASGRPTFAVPVAGLKGLAARLARGGCRCSIQFRWNAGVWFVAIFWHALLNRGLMENFSPQAVRRPLARAKIFRCSSHRTRRTMGRRVRSTMREEGGRKSSCS